MAARKKGTKQKPPAVDPVAGRLEFLAGLTVLGPDAKENEQIALAARVGLDSAAIARIFNKKPSAASMAVSRARKSK